MQHVLTTATITAVGRPPRATSTNLIVVTDRRRHAFLLHPVEGAGLTLMRLTVAAPMVPRPVFVAASPVLPAPATARELIDGRWQIKPLVRNSDYSVATGKDSEDIVPVTGTLKQAGGTGGAVRPLVRARALIRQFDADGDGHWRGGSPDLRTPAEPVYLAPKVLQMRSNFEIEENLVF